MKDSVSFAGHWPLTVGLMVGAIGAFNVPLAHAGQWEIVPLPPGYNYQTPEHQQWMDEEFIPRFPGQFDIKEYGFPNGQSHGIKDTPVMIREGKERTVGGRDSSYGNAPVQGMGRNTVYPHGGKGLVSFDDDFKVILRWQPRLLGRAQTPDPDDTPNLDLPIYLKVDVYAIAQAIDVSNNSRDTNTKRGNETVELSIVADGAEHSESSTASNVQGGNGTRAEKQKTFYIKLTPGKSPSDPLTIFSIKGKGKLEDNRQSPAYRGGYDASTGTSSMGWNRGSAFVGFEFTGRLTNYFLSISSPDLEDSYRKVTNASELPRTIRYVGGTNKKVIDDTQIGYSHPKGNGPWGVKIKRPADGSMTVESGVFLDEVAGPEWRGGGHFDASPQGFLTPSYSWSLKGGTVVNPGSYMNQSNAPSSVFAIIGLGSSMNSLSPKISQVDVTAKETDPSRSSVELDNTYNINWHFPAEWDAYPRKFGGIHWESASPVEVRIGTTNWQGNIEGNWRTRTIMAGEFPNSDDYYLEGAGEAMGKINDVLGLGERADDSVDGAIKAVKEPRLRLLLEVLKAGGSLLVSEQLEQTNVPVNQIINASFKYVWRANEGGGLTGEDGNNYSPPGSTWVDANGESKNKPNVDFSLLDEDYNSLSESDKQKFDQMTAERNNWELRNPIWIACRKRYLYKGDAYNSKGYAGIDYRGVDLYDKANSYITGTFHQLSAATPPENPNGGAINGG